MKTNILKRLSIILLSLSSFCNAQVKFYTGTCGGYGGRFPLIGRFGGSFSTNEYLHFNPSLIVGPIYSTQDNTDGSMLALRTGAPNIVINDSGVKIKTPGLYYLEDYSFLRYSAPMTFTIYETKNDTITLKKTDTSYLYKHDTIKIIKKDTITLKKTDTVFKYNTKFDTVRKFDTVKIVFKKTDTIFKEIHDTISKQQVVNGFKESNKFYYEKLHIDFGKPTKTYSGISYGSFDDSGFVSSSPTIQIHTNIKSNVRIFVYDNIGTFVDKEEFRISENKFYYFSFNGYNSIKQKVVNGIYLIRVITEQNNKFSNTVYKVGIKND